MRRLNRWLRELGMRQHHQPLEGDIDPVYTKDDVRNAQKGHMPFGGSDVDVVAYRQGDDLVVLVNKGPCIFRTLLVGAFREDLDRMQCNILMRDERIVLGEIPESMEELAKKLLR